VSGRLLTFAVQVERQEPEWKRLAQHEDRDHPEPLDLLHQDAVRNHIAEQGPDAECRHEQAGDARVGAEPRDDQHGHADEERRPAGVPDREHRCPDPQQRLTGEKADPSPDAAVFTVGRERLRHQPGDQRRGDEVGGGVDEEDCRGRGE